jgi:hypothetical protein
MYRRLFTSSSSSSSFVKSTSFITAKKSLIITATRFDRKMSTLSERYFADENTPFSRLEAKPFFETLSLKEKKYAHYMSRASFEGTRIIVTQTNPNALPIYELILKTFTNEQGEMVNSDALYQAR